MTGGRSLDTQLKLRCYSIQPVNNQLIAIHIHVSDKCATSSGHNNYHDSKGGSHVKNYKERQSPHGEEVRVELRLCETKSKWGVIVP